MKTGDILNKASELWSTSMVLRLTIGALIGAIGSSTVIGFIAEYAAVNYALAYGVRLPTEGVPYLRYAATALSLAMFVAAIFIFFLFALLLRGALMQLTSWELFRSEKDGKTIAAELPLHKYLIYAVIPAAGVTQGFFSVTFALVRPESIPSWVIILLLVGLTSIILFLGRKPAYLKPFIIASYLALVCAGFVLSFIPSKYAQALAFSGQGGDLPVSLEVSPASGPSELIDGNLFLRTRDYVILRDPGTSEVKEIPIGMVRQYRYLGERRW